MDVMAKFPKPDEVFARLRQEDVLISHGQSVADCTLDMSSVIDDR